MCVCGVCLVCECVWCVCVCVCEECVRMVYVFLAWLRISKQALNTDMTTQHSLVQAKCFYVHVHWMYSDKENIW